MDLHKTSRDLQNLIRVKINLKENVSCDLRISTTYVHNVYDGEQKHSTQVLMTCLCLRRMHISMNEQLEVGLYEDIRLLLGMYFYRYQVRILKLSFYEVTMLGVV